MIPGVEIPSGARGFRSQTMVPNGSLNVARPLGTGTLAGTLAAAYGRDAGRDDLSGLASCVYSANLRPTLVGFVEYAAFLDRVRDRLGADQRPPAYPAGDGLTKTSAAWLIDKAGFTKGYGGGMARISTKHTLALTNRGSAKAEDLLALAREVRDGVHSAFGITLVNEPVMVGATL